MNIEEILKMSWYLLVSHAYGDLAFQHNWIAIYKYKIVDGKYNSMWPAVLSAHSIICGGAVSLATGIWWLGCLEAIWHCITDWLSTNKKISFFWDQVSHLVAKVVWLVIWVCLK